MCWYDYLSELGPPAPARDFTGMPKAGLGSPPTVFGVGRRLAALVGGPELAEIDRIVCLADLKAGS